MAIGEVPASPIPKATAIGGGVCTVGSSRRTTSAVWCGCSGALVEGFMGKRAGALPVSAGVRQVTEGVGD